MRSRWVAKAFGDLIDIKHGFAFKGEYFRDEPPGDILLTPGNFAVGGGFKKDKLKYYEGPVPDEYALHGGELMVTMTDLSKSADTLGYPAFVPLSSGHSRYLHNQRLGKITAKGGEVVDLRYLYYLMCSKGYRHEVIASATGTTVKHTSPERIKRFSFLLPPPSEQKAIAHILGTLDDKIELNRRMNETLEGIAHSIFKSWFVDFDPVRAKIEGRWRLGESLPSLPAHLYDLFPDRFVNSEIGAIPAGWQVWRVSNAGNVICGKTPPTQVPEYYGEDVPFVTIPDMHGNVFATFTHKKLSYFGATSQRKKTLPAGAICVSCIATPGLVVITTEESQTNQQINSIVPSEPDQTYYWFWIFRALGDEIRAGGSGGSVLINLSTGRFSELLVLAPPAELRRSYHSYVKPIFERILAGVRETDNLAALRDALLPKLICGDLRVNASGKLADMDWR